MPTMGAHELLAYPSVIGVVLFLFGRVDLRRRMAGFLAHPVPVTGPPRLVSGGEAATRMPAAHAAPVVPHPNAGGRSRPAGRRAPLRRHPGSHQPEDCAHQLSDHAWTVAAVEVTGQQPRPLAKPGCGPQEMRSDSLTGGRVTFAQVRGWPSLVRHARAVVSVRGLLGVADGVGAGGPGAA